MTSETSGSAGEWRWFMGTRVRILLAAQSGVDGLSMIEHQMPFGESPPLHMHHNEDELFHVRRGTMRFRIGGVDRVVHAGEAVLAPKGIPHTFVVESRDGVECVTVTSGSNFETMIREASIPAKQDGLPPPAAPSPEQIEALVRLCARNHIDIIGAPLAVAA